MAPPRPNTLLRALEEPGFAIVRGVFTPEEVAEMSAAFGRLQTMASSLECTGLHRGAQFVLDPEPFRIHRVVWCAAADETLSRYGRDERLLALASLALGTTDMDQLINQAHFKLPGDEVAFEWHQDSRHRRFGTPQWRDVNGHGSFIETATAIDPMTEDNGPLKFIPGSARLGHVECLPGTETLPPVFDPRDAVTLLMEPGDVALFGPYVIHGSAPNRSTGSRRVFLNGFAAPGANARDYPGEGSGRRLRLPG